MIDQQPSGERRPVRGNRGTAWAIAAMVAAALVALLAYRVGKDHGNHVRALTGDAYVGAHQAGVRVDGWSYGITESVQWVDRSGASHESGWPSCLAPLGATVRVRFGEIAVQGPQQDSWREVVWVDCRKAVRVR